MRGAGEHEMKVRMVAFNEEFQRPQQIRMVLVWPKVSRVINIVSRHAQAAEGRYRRRRWRLPELCVHIQLYNNDLARRNAKSVNNRFFRVLRNCEYDVSNPRGWRIILFSPRENFRGKELGIVLVLQVRDNNR